VDVAVFILDADPLAPSRPVKITITVPVIFTAIPVAPIAVMSAAVAVPIMEDPISIAPALSITLAFTITASLTFVRLLCLLLWFWRGLSGGSLSEAGGYPAHENS
jgi:hypothetical protein